MEAPTKNHHSAETILGDSNWRWGFYAAAFLPFTTLAFKACWFHDLFLLRSAEKNHSDLDMWTAKGTNCQENILLFSYCLQSEYFLWTCSGLQTWARSKNHITGQTFSVKHQPFALKAFCERRYAQPSRLISLEDAVDADRLAEVWESDSKQIDRNIHEGTEPKWHIVVVVVVVVDNLFGPHSLFFCDLQIVVKIED